MRLSVAAAGLAVAVGMLVVGAPAAAHAVPCGGEPIAWSAPTTATVEYGQYWGFQAVGTGAGMVDGPWDGRATMPSAPDAVSSFASWDSPNCTITVFANPSMARPLAPGQYQVTAEMFSTAGGGTSSTTASPAQLTVTPAALGIALTVTPDPSNPANAIVSAAFTGSFVDNFFSTVFDGAPLSPQGTWKIRVTDAEGETVHEFDADRADTSDVLGVSSYWSDVAPGDYSVAATFASSGATAPYFTIAAPQPVAFTSAPAPGATSDATPPPEAPPASDSVGLTLPMWVPIAAGVLSAGLLALMIVQIVRLSHLRRPAAPTAEVAP